MIWRAPLVVSLLALVGVVALEPIAWWDRSEAASDGYSVERAWTDVRRLAVEPRPSGSPALAHARDYIVEQIRAIGLEPDVQHTLAVRELSGGRVREAMVDNIVTRLRGQGDGRALLLAAHYDTVAISPGAADNGAAVATLIETLRDLRASGSLRNDVIVLFTDSEEHGLMGARAFVTSHPWAKDVRVVVNLDARGAGGPSLMFQTSPGTDGLLLVLASVAPRPIAPGFAEDVYRLLPNDTDFSVFARLGRPGFNFAFIERPTVYHRATDTIAQLDRRSLWHQGAQALALGRWFGNADLDHLPVTSARTWFNLPAIGLIAYPRVLTQLLGVVAIALALITVVRAMRHRRVTLTRLAIGMTLLPLAGLIAFGVGRLTSNAMASIALATLVPIATLLVVMKRLGRPHVAVAIAIWWGVLTAVALIMLPASSYLIVWPALAALPGLDVVSRRSDTAPRSVSATAALFISIVPAVLLWTPAVALTATAIGRGAMLAVAIAVLVGLVSAHLLALIASPHSGEEERMTLGDVLKKEREQRKLPPGDAAVKLRISEDAYLELESGRSPAETWAPLLAEIAISLSTPTSRLLADSGKFADTQAGQAGPLIRRYREQRSQSPEDLARGLGIPVEQYEAIESGGSPIETYGPLMLGFAELIEQPVFNLFYPCGLPFAQLEDYP